MKTSIVRVLTLLFFVAVGRENLLGQAAAPTPDQNPEGDTGALKSQVQTGGSYDAHSGNATRSVTDLQVPGALGDYGLDFTRYWNSLHNEDTNTAAEWPQDFGASGWSHSWRWSATYDEQLPEGDPPPTVRNFITSITVTYPDGHATKFKIARTNSGTHQDPRAGPPYYAVWGERDWPMPGPKVRDHLAEMAQDGHEFWLYRADGGSVHFEGFDPQHQNASGYAWWSYRATEVFDPHGLRTELEYTDNLLTKVKQEGDRSLKIIWKYLPGYATPVIGRVETDGLAAAGQQVTYKYTKFPYQSQSTAFYVLAIVAYQNDPAPGQTTSAVYTYGSSYNDNPNTPPSYFPLLKVADDPRYAGAMTKIRYNYFGDYCRPPEQPPSHPPEGFYNWHYFNAEAIAEEQSGETGAVVARFQAACHTGERKDYNGLGSWRTFYFGSSAGDPDLLTTMGYELTKVTDFVQGGTYPPNPPSRKQTGSEPGRIWDGLGIRTDLEYDDSGNPSAIHYVVDDSHRSYDRLDSSGSANPDPDRMRNKQHHWLFKKTDERGQITRYTRDERRRVVQIDYHDGSQESYTYNQFNQVESHTLPSHHPSAHAIQYYHYNGLQQLDYEWNTVDDWEARKEYTYDSLGRVATMRDGVARNATPPAPFTVRMTYNGRHKVTSVEYPPTGGAPSPTVRYEYDKYGNCTVMTDEMGHRKEFTYDSYRRCTSHIEWVFGPGPDCNNLVSRRWDWHYDRYIDGAGFPASAHTSKQWRVQVEPVFNSDGHRRVSVQKFDRNDQVIEGVTGMIEDSSGWHVVEGVTELHNFTYDANGQKSSFTDPQLRVTTYEYDIRNRLWKTNETVNTIPRTTQTLYDKTGNKLSVEFPDGKMQHWEDYDAFGQARRFIDERGNPTDMIYCWGPMKKLYKVITHRAMDGGSGTEDQWTEFGYDLMGRPTQTVFPDLSIEKSTYKYGLLDTFKTRRGQMKRLSYDARGREISHTWDNGAAPGISRVWDDANRLMRISNSFATIDYSYDDAGQVVTEGTTVAGSGGQTPAGSGVLKQLNYCRYPSGEVARVTYPNGFVVKREYTARGQLQIVRDSSQQKLVEYTYLKDGKVEFQDYGNGVRSAFAYNGRGMTIAVHHKRNASGANLSYRDYWRDERDRITAWKRSADSGLNGMEDGRGDRYVYDEEGQLKSASYRAVDPSGAARPAQRSDIFQYDALGNREGSNYLASRGTMDFPRRNNGLNQYAGWMPYSPILYDDPALPGRGNGVLDDNGGITASYNALNQPMGMWSSAYGSTNYLWFGYDPLGRCVKRWVSAAVGTPPNQQAPPPSTNPATYYYYEGWNLVQEGPSATNAERIYVHGGRVDEIVASQSGGVWNYHQYDARGHCTLLTDTSGLIREQYEYDAFGYPYTHNAAGTKILAAAQWGNRFLFTGREWLKELKVYDYRARMYQPELGRFLQPDPKHFAAGDYNLYRYCHNDPVNHTDPTGLELLIRDPDPKWRADRLAELNKIGNKNEDSRNAINKLIGSDKVHIIQRSNGENHTDRYFGNGSKDTLGSVFMQHLGEVRTALGAAIRSGSEIRYNPDKTETKWGSRPGYIGLAHEIGHALDMDQGTWRNDRGLTEGRAIWWENESRKAVPMGLRGYDQY